ncbi:hypothetical protein GC173_03645 [bacterium]|nr:hypothetical protein [bacterium]
MRATASHQWGRFIPPVLLLLLLTILLPGKLARLPHEPSFWTDEAHSILLAELSWSGLWEALRMEQYPPGFFWLLGCWQAMATTLGIEPGLALARSLPFACWLLMVAGAWWLGGRAFGRATGALLAGATALSTPAAAMAMEVRGYIVVLAALLLAFLILVVTAGSEDDKSEHRRRWYWVIYAGLLVVALYQHLLAAAAVGCLGLAWLIEASLHRGFRSPAFRDGLLAHLTAAVIYLPWLVRVPRQIAILGTWVPDWSQTTSLQDLLSVPVYWFFFTPVDLTEPDFARLAWIGGGVALALPLGATALALRKRQATSYRPGESRLLLWGGVALGLSLGFVLVLWALTSLGVASVFYRARYPMLLAPIWTVGLVLVAVWACRGKRHPHLAAMLLLLPWAGMNLIGQQMGDRAAFEVPPKGEWAASFLPERGATKPRVIAFPAALVPYNRKALAGFDVRPPAEFPAMAAEGSSVAVIDLWGWDRLRTMNEVLMVALVREGTGFERIEQFDRIPRWRSFAVYRLEGARKSWLEDRFPEGILQPRDPFIPPDAVWSSQAASWTMSAGWSHLIADGDLNVGRCLALDEAQWELEEGLRGRYRLGLAFTRRGGSHDPLSGAVMIGAGGTTELDFEEADGLATSRVPIEFDGSGSIVRLRAPASQATHLAILSVWLIPAE